MHLTRSYRTPPQASSHAEGGLPRPRPREGAASPWQQNAEQHSRAQPASAHQPQRWPRLPASVTQGSPGTTTLLVTPGVALPAHSSGGSSRQPPSTACLLAAHSLPQQPPRGEHTHPSPSSSPGGHFWLPATLFIHLFSHKTYRVLPAARHHHRDQGCSHRQLNLLARDPQFQRGLGPSHQTCPL